MRPGQELMSHNIFQAFLHKHFFLFHCVEYYFATCFPLSVSVTTSPLLLPNFTAGKPKGPSATLTQKLVPDEMSVGREESHSQVLGGFSVVMSVVLSLLREHKRCSLTAWRHSLEKSRISRLLPCPWVPRSVQCETGADRALGASGSGDSLLGDAGGPKGPRAKQC